MEWSHRSSDPSELLRALALPPYPELMLVRALRRIHEPGPLAVLHDAVLDSHPARLNRAPGPRSTSFNRPGGRSWRMALLPRAHELLMLRSPDAPERAACTIVGLILGGLAPGGDLLSTTPGPDAVSRRLHHLSRTWGDDWAALGLSRDEEAWIRAVCLACVLPQVDLPHPIWGPWAVVRTVAHAVDRPGTIELGAGTACLPAWADPDMPKEAAREELRHTLLTPAGAAEEDPDDRAQNGERMNFPPRRTA